MSDVPIKNRFHIDEFTISSFCPNTIKVNGADQNKFALFYKYLSVFHDDETLYEQTPQRYSSYIMYKVLMDSLIKNKNILTYEQYVFNVLKGYSEQSEDKSLTVSQIAKIWNILINIYNVLLEYSKDSTVHNIEYNKRIFFNMKHINVDKMSSNYYLDIPLVIYYKDRVIPVLILPREIKNPYANIVNYLPIKYFGKKVDRILVFNLNMNNYSYEYNSIANNSKFYKESLDFLDGLYIDFNRVNTFNCINCPLSCTPSEILNVKYKIEPYNPKNRLVKFRK